MVKIGIVGTFDVENYGDLLFPLLAEYECTTRLGTLELERFSYRRKTTSGWIYPVTPLDQFEEALHGIDAVLIGGGHLIRFDKQVADGYLPTDARIHHPTGYWLSPALAAASQKIPVSWNAPSASPQTPQWARPLVKTALEASEYVSVRDAQTLRELRDIGYDGAASVVPDTAFGLSRLLPPGKVEERVQPLLDEAGISGPYIVVQATEILAELAVHLAAMPEFEGKFSILALPIGPILGDRVGAISMAIPEARSLDRWPAPLDIAALIAASSGCVAVSLHLTVTALAYGLPILRHDSARKGKYGFLEASENVFLPGEAGDGVVRFANRLGERRICSLAHAALGSLDAHWTAVAETVRQRASSIDSRSVISYSIWNRMIAEIESEANIQHDKSQISFEKEKSSLQLQVSMEHRITESQVEIESLSQRISKLLNEQRQFEREYTALKAKYQISVDNATRLQAALTNTSEKLGNLTTNLHVARREAEFHHEKSLHLQSQLMETTDHIKRISGKLATKTLKLARIRRKAFWPPTKWIPGTARYAERRVPVSPNTVMFEPAVLVSSISPQTLSIPAQSHLPPHNIDIVDDSGMFGKFSRDAIGVAINRLRIFRGFNPKDYKHFGPDLADVEPYQHFIRHGGVEGRRIGRPEHFARLLGLSSALEPHASLVPGGNSAIASRVIDAFKGDIRIAIYVSSLGNNFMREIAEDLLSDFRSQGIEVNLYDETASIEGRPPFCLFVAPHEFFFLGRGVEWLRDSVIASGFMFNTEQIQTGWFAKALPVALISPGVFDIFYQNSILFDQASVPSLHVLPGARRRPVVLEESDYLHPLYRVLPSSALETADPSTPFIDRPIDISFFGSHSRRRDQFLARNASLLSEFEAFLYCRRSEGPLGLDAFTEPLTRLAGHVAGHSKIALNIHRDEFGYFEWHRMVRAGMCAGSLVVSDPCLPHPIFKAGEHYLEDNIRHLPNLIEWLLRTEDGWHEAERVRRNVDNLISGQVDRDIVVAAMLQLMVKHHPDRTWRERLEQA